MVGWNNPMVKGVLIGVGGSLSAIRRFLQV